MHKCNQSPIISVKKRERASLAHKSQSTDSRTPGLAKLVHIQNP